MNPYEPTTAASTSGASPWRWTLLFLPPLAFTTVLGLAYLCDCVGLYLLTPLLLGFGTLGVGVGASVEVAKELGGENRLLVFAIGAVECLIVLVPYALIIDSIARMFP